MRLQMMQQPAFQEAMQSMLARPDMMNAMMNANPQMRQMIDSNPGMRWGAQCCVCCMLVWRQCDRRAGTLVPACSQIFSSSHA